MAKKEKKWLFLRIQEEDEARIKDVNDQKLKHLPFGHGSYNWIHVWSFDSLEEAKEAKRIILENCPRARDKF